VTTTKEAAQGHAGDEGEYCDSLLCTDERCQAYQDGYSTGRHEALHEARTMTQKVLDDLSKAQYGRR
jgi:hypothetical protein